MVEYRVVNDLSLYEIGSDGTVRNIVTGKVLGGKVTRKGYREFCLQDNGLTVYRRAHRLVATHFIANPYSYPQVDHIDEDKQNNDISNLRWCTNQQNKDFYFQNHPEKVRKKIERKYKNKHEMILATGKPIVVDGINFISCGSAAQYIVDNTSGKKKSTISKELRNYVNGKRKKFKMYNIFDIGHT